MDERQAWLALTRGELEPDTTVRLPMLSGSMRPLLPVGSEIEIRAATWRQCRPGDIIVLNEEGKLTAHRLLLKLPLPDGGALCYEKGDLNRLGTFTLGRCVVGLVVAVIDEGGRRDAFTSAEARDRGSTLASASLRADLVRRLLAPPRALWGLLRGNSD